jgi:hypothetical protein
MCACWQGLVVWEPFAPLIPDGTPDKRGINAIFDATWARDEKIITPEVRPPPKKKNILCYQEFTGCVLTVFCVLQLLALHDYFIWLAVHQARRSEIDENVVSVLVYCVCAVCVLSILTIVCCSTRTCCRGGESTGYRSSRKG